MASRRASEDRGWQAHWWTPDPGPGFCLVSEIERFLWPCVALDGNRTIGRPGNPGKVRKLERGSNRGPVMQTSDASRVRGIREERIRCRNAATESDTGRG